MSLVYFGFKDSQIHQILQVVSGGRYFNGLHWHGIHRIAGMLVRN
jgi:hypothetical protein